LDTGVYIKSREIRIHHHKHLLSSLYPVSLKSSSIFSSFARGSEGQKNRKLHSVETGMDANRSYPDHENMWRYDWHPYQVPERPGGGFR
jgi:hypothetical protein